MIGMSRCWRRCAHEHRFVLCGVRHAGVVLARVAMCASLPGTLPAAQVGAVGLQAAEALLPHALTPARDAAQFTLARDGRTLALALVPCPSSHSAVLARGVQFFACARPRQRLGVVSASRPLEHLCNDVAFCRIYSLLSRKDLQRARYRARAMAMLRRSRRFSRSLRCIAPTTVRCSMSARCDRRDGYPCKSQTCAAQGYEIPLAEIW